MKRITSQCFQLTACFLLLAVSTLAQDASKEGSKDSKKANPTGTWTWSTPARNGGQARETTLKLKMEGDKVTGTVTGRQGAEIKIENAKLNGDEISFDITREFQGNSRTMKYKGKIAGDTITGKVSRERDGETRETDWTAKRKVEDKKPS